MSMDQPSVALPSTPDASPPEITNPSEPAPALSKSAQKRQAKAERFAQLKQERRAREKEEKALKRKEREERAAAGEDVGPSDSKKRRVTREGEGPVLPFNARIVVDLGFDEKMTDKEVGSLCSQLAYTYASHRRTKTPFTGLLFTSLNGRALKHLDSINDGSYRRWKGAEWWTEDVDGLWNPPAEGVEQQPQETTANEPVPTNVNEDTMTEQASTAPTPPATNLEFESNGGLASDPLVPTVPARGKPRRPRRQPAPQTRASCSRESVVYLTADAEDELLELQEGETYVIGGIVDRNRYKLAMQKVMPKRKFNANGKKGKTPKGTSSEELDENGDGEEPLADDGDAVEPIDRTTVTVEPDRVAS
ncbi:tRNA (guanine(9)-N(1))-methyltransferase [Ceratobasidium sp. 392]|nr:tRNA (guanine(9)-N(1))-methyltransferase [Ceratobasidium sp. 392]